MDIKNSQLYKDVEKSEKILNKLSNLLKTMKFKLESYEKFVAYEISLEYAKEAEKLTNKARLMPIASGYTNALNEVENIIVENTNSKVGYLKDNIFYMQIPALLPKKESGNPSYIRATTKYILEDYFKRNEKKRIEEKVVIVVKHNYSKDRDYREYRDHDNIELNAVIDLLALYVLVDDSPKRCDHYYLSDIDKYDNTEIFIVPENIFLNGFLKDIKSK